ncbi:protease B nonderepressible form [Cadophora gregata]|uniref:protease B nonderepressible form n=1 Tax=Cadophora gregata TaxID=51156 RepID=UPI0026DD5433|nr:protease B nonderepressible form [Cadophora gregata]KAK0124648.1 protease B nonderepressible form [Cadophora gregata]KAK0129492.1 protease B nonderepressible form [Cadophora gregata f. sp. sojae]
MRQRVTFLQDPADSIDPSKLEITSTSISTPELTAAREERITFGFDELPQELYKVLKASHELHIRWVTENVFETRAPLVARLSPGLHLFYTPLRNEGSSEFLCPLLKKVFGDLDCISPEKSFTTLPRDRFSHSSASQFYSPLASLLDFTTYLSHKLCPSDSGSTPLDAACLSRVQALHSASTLEIDFDTISHALTLTAFFPPSTQSLALSKPPSSSSIKDSRMEIGIFSVEKPKEVEELSLGGFLTVVGEHSKPSPTLFSFPARHHPLPLSQTFTSGFVHPTGLHPTLEVNITSSEPPLDDRACSLHAHLTLPRAVFVDKYQLSDPLFMASKNLAKLHYITSPVDLEAPAYTLTSWGSSVLLELAPPSSQYKSDSEPLTAQHHQQWTSLIPLHLRYLPPSQNTSGLTPLDIPYPILFWACTADEGSKFPINPFDRVNLGYDGLFGPRTLFYHLSPSAAVWGGKGGDAKLVNSLDVPVLDLDRSRFVEVGTAIGVLLGFGWVCWCLLGVWRGSGYQAEGNSQRNSGGLKEEDKKRK